jgi:ketosteroid isomerase-like protein
MHRIIAAVFSIALMIGSAFASDEVDVMRTIRKFIDSFNKGELNTALDICAAQSAIIDEFPPYLWQGATGCADWSKDFDAYAQKNGITDPKVILARAHIDVTEDRAYVVAPAHFTFRQKGKRSTEQGSLTVALQNVANGWRIAGWAWAKR